MDDLENFDDHEQEEDEDPASQNVYITVLWEPLAYSGETVMSWGPPHDLERQLRHLVTTPVSQNTIDVWLQSIGGSADEAYRHMLLLREYAARVRVVVGNHAKSAATLMLLGADEIYMGPTSELGPLDAQVWVDEQDKRISALDIARSVEHLGEFALDLALSSGGAVHQVTGIPRREVLPEVLTFASDFVRPIVAKLDPSAIHRASNQLDVARQYGQRLLKMRADPMDASAASSLTYHLVNDYPDHGFIISRDEAVEIGLPAKALAEYDLAHVFQALSPKFEEGSDLKVVAFKRPEPDDLAEGESRDDDESDEREPGMVASDEALSSPGDGAQLVAMPDPKREDDEDEEAERRIEGASD